MARRRAGKKAGIFIEGGNQAVERFTRRITGAVNEKITGVMEGMEDAIDLVADRALELTPRDTGDLQGSQRRRTFVESGKLIGEVTYNEDGNAPHAGFVHEIPADHSQASYPNNPPEAQYKFLQAAFAEKKKEMVDLLAKNARRKDRKTQ